MRNVSHKLGCLNTQFPVRVCCLRRMWSLQEVVPCGTLGVSFQFTVSWCVDEMLLTSFLFQCPAIMDSNTLELETKINSFFPKLLLVTIFYQSNKSKHTTPQKVSFQTCVKCVSHTLTCSSTLPAHKHFSKSGLWATHCDLISIP